ncbi:SPOR domain-containing protein [Marinobacteraceae bacterium S3BR75-40.1]
MTAASPSPQKPQDALTEELTFRFGLASDPFADAPERFFGGAQRQHCLEILRHMVSFGDMALVVTGEKGAGRSRLLAELCRIEKDAIEFRLLPSRALDSVTALGQLLWQQTRKPHPKELSGQGLIDAFFAWSQEQGQRGRRWCLLVEDADRLPGESLDALLAGFRQVDRNIAAVPVLTGTEQLIRRMVQEAEVSKIDWLHQVHLRPLTRDEVRQYIERSFEWAGGDAQGALDEEKLVQLEKMGRGNIGRIRRIAPGILTGRIGQDAEPPRPVAPRASAGLARWIIGVVGLLLASFLLVDWFYEEPGQDASEISTTVTSTPAPDRKIVRLDAQNSMADLQGAEDEKPIFASDVTGESESEPSVSSEVAEKPEQSEGLPAIDQVLKQTEQAPPEEASQSAPEIGTKVAEGPETLTPPNESEEKSAPAADNEMTEETAPVASTERQEAPTAETSPKAPAPEESAKTATKPAQPAFEAEWPERFREKAWVEQRPDSHYTIQMLASYNEATAVRYIRDNTADGLYYIRSTHKDKPWFVVLFGDFPDYAAAKQAESDLPRPLSGKDTWVRSFKGI